MIRDVGVTPKVSTLIIIIIIQVRELYAVKYVLDKDRYILRDPGNNQLTQMLFEK